ncbi:MAG: hypothetical protein KDD61_03350 [Bdellovibrionales bacterium]|nr:hypothetical protein [Bdellovibrionales bacterium]
MKYIMIFLIQLSMILSATAHANQDSQAFPFFDRPIQFRFHQNFFKQAGEVIEDILKTSGVIEPVANQPQRGVLRIPTGEGRDHVISYSSLKPSFWISGQQLITNIQIQIDQSKIYVQPNNSCYVDLKGRLSFQVEASVNALGDAPVALNDRLYNDKNISYNTVNCGFFMRMGIAALIKDKLEQGIQDGFRTVFNSQELKYISSLDLGKPLLARNILINQPFNESYYLDSDIDALSSQLEVELGFLGYLSNNQGQKMIQINNPNTKAVQELGLEWAFNSGVKALSQNIADPQFQPQLHWDSGSFPNWGQSAMEQIGAPLKFDAGIMIKETFVQNLIATLYQAGFFNFQAQDSLLKSDSWSIHPLERSDLFQVQWSNGEVLSEENFQDSRMNMSMLEVPSIRISGKTLHLEIPKFSFKYQVQSSTGENTTIIHFLARMNLIATIDLDSEGHLRFAFNNEPIQNFVVLERTGIVEALSDEGLLQMLNQDISQVLNEFKLELPLLSGKKAKLKYIGLSEAISEKSAANNNALSIYLDITSQ